MRKQLALGVAAATLFLAGCADMNMSDTQRRTAIGAGAGALGGAGVAGRHRAAAVSGAP